MILQETSSSILNHMIQRSIFQKKLIFMSRLAFIFYKWINIHKNTTDRKRHTCSNDLGYFIYSILNSYIYPDLFLDSVLDGDTSAQHDYNPCKSHSMSTPWAWVVYTLVEYLHQGRGSLEEAHADLKSGSGESLCAGSPGIWVTRARSRRDIFLALWTSQSNHVGGWLKKSVL